MVRRVRRKRTIDQAEKEEGSEVKPVNVRSDQVKGKCYLIVLYVYLNITGRFNNILPCIYLLCLSKEANERRRQ